MGQLFSPADHDQESLYPRFANFRSPAPTHDPERKFRNGLPNSILGFPEVSAFRDMRDFELKGWEGSIRSCVCP